MTYTLTVDGREKRLVFLDRLVAEDMAAHYRAQGHQVTINTSK